MALTASRLHRRWLSPGLASRSAPAPLWLSIPTLVIAIGALLPLAYVAAKVGTASPRETAGLLFRPYIAGLLANTLGLVAGVTSGSLVLGVGLAWLVERTDLPGRQGWGLLLSLPLAVPAFVSSFAWLSLSAKSEGLISAIFILTLAEYPLVFLPASVALRGMDGDLDDVAASLGAGSWRQFARLAVPHLRPAMAASSLLVALHMLIEFGPLAILRVDTFTTAIYAAFELEFDSAGAAVLSGVLLVACCAIVAAERWLRGSTRFTRVGSGVTRQPRRHPLGRWRGPALAAVSLTVALALGFPVAALGYWIAVGRSASFTLARIGHALVGSLQLAGVGSVVTTVGGLVLVLAAMRTRDRLASVAERLPFAIHALPGVVIALSLVFFTLWVAPALYQTTVVLIAAYALAAMPLAQSAVRVAVEQLPSSIEEAALSTGRTPWHVFRRVTLPSVAPGLAAATVLVFLSLLKELTATLILAPTGTDTLSIEIWSHTSQMEYGAAAPYALLLVLVSGLPAYLFGRRLRHGVPAA